MKKKYQNLKELTPKEMVCGEKDCCPALLETEDGKCYLIVGKKVDPRDIEGYKVGEDEASILVDKGLLKNLS